MAITSEYQILNLNSVNNALGNLDTSVRHINDAIRELKDSKNYCGIDNFSIKGENTLPTQIDDMILKLEGLIERINSAKTAIYQKAESINRQEWREYKAYLEAQEEKAKQESQMTTM